MANSWDPANTWKPTTKEDGKYFQETPKVTKVLNLDLQQVASLTIQNNQLKQEISATMLYLPNNVPRYQVPLTLIRGTTELCLCAINQRASRGMTLQVKAEPIYFKRIGHEISAGKRQENWELYNPKEPLSLVDTCAKLVRKSELEPISQGAIRHMFESQERHPAQLRLGQRPNTYLACTCKNK